MSFDAEKRAFFVRVLGEQATANLEAGLTALGKNLEDQGVDWKDVKVVVQGAAPPASSTTPVSQYINQLRRPPRARVASATASLRGPAAPYLADLGKGERAATS